MTEERKDSKLSPKAKLEKLQESLTKFEDEQQTLIDYFAILGFSNAQLRRLIHEMLQEEEQNRQNGLEPGNQNKSDSNSDDEIEMDSQNSVHASDIRCFMSVVGPQKVYLGDSVQKGSRRILRSSVLERFPPIDRSYCKMPEEIVDFFFDNKEKVTFKDQKDKNINDECFKQAVCTNADGRISYITCHMFYEDLADIDEVLITLDPLSVLNDIQEDDEPLIKAPDSPKFAQLSAALETSFKLIYQVDEEMEAEMVKKNNFDNQNQKTKIVAVSNKQKPKLPKGVYFVKKALCLLTHSIPASKELNNILIFLRCAATQGAMYAEFEDYINNIVFKIPLPDQKFTKKMRLHLPGIPDPNKKNETLREQYYKFQPQQIIFCFPHSNQLPYVNPDVINSLFKALDVDNILLLFKRVLLDTSNLFISNDATKLVNCCEAIKALIFPFKFELIYVPNLPEILLDRVEAPYIFMLGIAGKDLYKKVKEQDQIKDGTYIIKLDKNKIFQKPHSSTIINKYGTTKEKIDEDLPDLPFKHYETLHKQIKKFGEKLRNKKDKDAGLSKDDVETIRESFYKFFVNLLRFYEEGEYREEEEKSTNKKLSGSVQNSLDGNLFRNEKFLAAYTNIPGGHEEIQFLRVFTGTSMFSRLTFRDRFGEDKNDIQLFKEHMKLSRIGKKRELEKFDEKCPIYDCAPFFDFCARFMKKSEVSLKKQFQSVHGQTLLMPSDSFQGKQKLSEVAMATQKVECDCYLYQVIPQYLKKDKLNQLFEAEINDPSKSFGHYKGWRLISAKKIKDLRNKDIENLNRLNNINYSKRQLVQHKFDSSGGDKQFTLNIYLCWLLAWCGTLAYQDAKEKDFLAHQAVEVLKRMVYKVDSNPTIEIFEIMMDTVFNHGSEQIVRKLFELYSNEFKLQQNTTMIYYMLQAKGKGAQLGKKKISSIKEGDKIIDKKEVMRPNYLELKEQESDLQKNDKQYTKSTVTVKFVYEKLEEMIQAIEIDTEKKKEAKPNFVKKFFGELLGGNKSKEKTNTAVNVSQTISADPNKQIQEIQEFNNNLNESLGMISPELAKKQVLFKKQMSQEENINQKQLQFGNPLTKAKTDIPQVTKSIQSKRMESVHQSSNQAYLDPKNKKYKEMRKKFKERSFLLPEDQLQGDDVKVFLQLRFKCGECGTNQCGDYIMKNLNSKPTATPVNGQSREFNKDYFFKCNKAECASRREDKPRLTISIGSQPEQIETVDFLHPIKLRYELEKLFHVDSHYRSLCQTNVNQIRQENKQIYWVLIWLFCFSRLPYDFLIPYVEEAQKNDLSDQILKVRRQLVLDEYIDHFGLQYYQRLEKKMLRKKLREERQTLKLQKKFDDDEKLVDQNSAAVGEQPQDQRMQSGCSIQKEDHSTVFSPVKNQLTSEQHQNKLLFENQNKNTGRQENFNQNQNIQNNSEITNKNQERYIKLQKDEIKRRKLQQKQKDAIERIKKNRNQSADDI